MTDVVFRHGPHRPGAQVVGYGPKPGDVRDDKGRLVLVYQYQRQAGKSRAAAIYADAVEAAGGKVLRPGDIRSIEGTPVSVWADEEKPTKRGVRAEQEKLL